MEAPWWKRGLPSTLSHNPIFGLADGRMQFQVSALSAMATKYILIGLGLFAFLVMPTCAFLTVHREFRLKDAPLPLSCAAMFPDLKGDVGGESLDGKVFESLCWSFGFTTVCCTLWGAGLAVVLSVVGLLTAGAQDRSGLHQE